MNEILFSSITLIELEILIQKSVRKVLAEKSETVSTLPSDRCGISQATEITRLSKSQIYKLTFSNRIPFKKFGKTLIFSRQELFAWMEENTVSFMPDGDVITMQLMKSARRKLK
jgi:excisionase family DNA binding protein